MSFLKRLRYECAREPERVGRGLAFGVIALSLLGEASSRLYHRYQQYLDEPSKVHEQPVPEDLLTDSEERR